MGLKFKLGDKVVVREDCKSKSKKYRYDKKGNLLIQTIRKVDKICKQKLYYETSTDWYYEKELELYNNDNPRYEIW
jgi:hypothetical protein